MKRVITRKHLKRLGLPAATLTCRRPDRDVARLTCGHSLPCPHHTYLIEGQNVTIPPAAPSGLPLRRVRTLAAALGAGKRKR